MIPLSRIDAFLRKGMGQERARERSPFGLALAGGGNERASGDGIHSAMCVHNALPPAVQPVILFGM